MSDFSVTAHCPVCKQRFAPDDGIPERCVKHMWPGDQWEERIYTEDRMAEMYSGDKEEEEEGTLYPEQGPEVEMDGGMGNDHG